MEHIEKIVVGILLFAITSIMAYLFKMRQLYATSPKLYRHAQISKDGSMCELVVFNRGNQPEESIRVELPPELKCELLASSAAGVSLNGGVIEIERLHKLKNVSAMLLVENGLLDTSKIAVSSKNTAGKVIKNEQAIPPNYAFLFAAILGFFFVLTSFLLIPWAWERGHNIYAHIQMSSVINQGWDNLGDYMTSDLRSSYSNKEFPLRMEAQKRQDNQVQAKFAIYNKSARILKVYADRPNKKYDSDESPDIENFSSAEVPPMSAGTINVKVPYKDGTPTRVVFSLTMDSDRSAGITYTFPER